MMVHCVDASRPGVAFFVDPRCLRLIGATLLAMVACCPTSVLAQAQPPGSLPAVVPPNATFNENFIRDDQQRLLEQQRERLDQLERLPGEAVAAPEVRPDDGGCLDIHEIELEGASLLSERQRGRLLQPYLGRCLSAAELNGLLGEVTQWYLERGYVTTRAYLPEQDLTQGRLRVVVAEGRLEALDSGGVRPSPREVLMASPTRPGDILNLRDLEQLIDQLNRLPSRRAQMELLPGDALGGSRVRIDPDAGQGRPVRVALGRSNDGSRETGEQQWTLGGEWDSPLGLADQLSLQFGHDVTGASGIGSSNQYVAYRLPWGRWNFRYQYSRSDYRSIARADGFRFDLDGASERHSLSAERLMHRDRVSTTSASVGVSRLSTRNDLDETRIEVSSQRLSELSLGLNHGRRLGRGLINADLGWHKGLDILGAQDDDDQPAGSPKAQGERTTLTLSYARPFEVLGQSLTVTSLASGQWSDDALYSPQRLSLGGQYSVRGYKDQTLSGDSGGYWRNEISWARPLPTEVPLVDRLEASLAYDVGVIRHDDDSGDQHGRLSGMALGLGVSGDYLSASVTLAKSIDRPDAIDHRESPVYFTVQARF
ncbi:ShlB/FhaC/HecB family hemolysin secretion/activation protein [Halomonas sp. DP8Y7-3]|uniref:ShlB/FhaC/HecB family hemolysin secretion/activation protein n=1 Tax=Halomonas sp. DP8Y7-3 TaxID=2859079 RepID=UPI001C93E75B|nr:ShlB/FhaC/HecB family hemolysin secretion/activation protein [Halomonas sp. DP8Y7-3]MBY5930165.1 ShlB/FhaC/HecB family hemolysin secretion/activation protein [Halomonas sp. DP8Y7-3]